ncbi:hypothetical protein GCM10008955_40770 [Deinococcus malanensis]|uniref:Uncharacterized protein n=1 Tax=Deinococcus malanensis TaxID=1706855 RepID=A0ABQ2F1W8_9DEIO|nr:hypothetical protein [Deinococcus malanensis]GGK42805.1 hypothetical protein GCM10008955_40770 [Deinococcus malanensis]
MNDDLSRPLYTPANDVYEERLTQHFYEAEVRRLLRRPGARARLAATLRRLADRVDYCTVPLHAPRSSMR